MKSLAPHYLAQLRVPFVLWARDGVPAPFVAQVSNLRPAPSASLKTCATDLMPTPGEHKTVQARTWQYAQEIGWRYVPRAEAQARRGFDPRRGNTRRPRTPRVALLWVTCCTSKCVAFNPKYKERKARSSANCSG